MTWAFVLAACLYRFGRPEPAAAHMAVGEIRVAAAEPALREALAGALGGSLAARGALGSGPAVDVRVLLATTEVVAGDGGGLRVRRARLRVAYQLLGPAPREVVLSGERSWPAEGDATLDASAARAEAFRALAAELSEDAVEWLLYAPRGER